MSERRNDVGTKLIYAAMGIMLTLFFTHVYNIGKEAIAMGNDNKKEISNNSKEIAVLQQQYKEIINNLCELKKDIKTLLISQTNIP